MDNFNNDLNDLKISKIIVKEASTPSPFTKDISKPDTSQKKHTSKLNRRHAKHVPKLDKAHTEHTTHNEESITHKKTSSNRKQNRKQQYSSSSKHPIAKRIFKGTLLFMYILCILMLIIYSKIQSKLNLINTATPKVEAQAPTKVIYAKEEDLTNLTDLINSSKELNETDELDETNETDEPSESTSNVLPEDIVLSNGTVIPEGSTVSDGVIKTTDGNEISLVAEEFVETEDIDPNLEVVEPEDVTWDEDIPDTQLTKIATAKNVTNILLIGQDKREGESRQRSDSMILCSITNDSIIMTSFMRDLYVQIPGFSDNRMNAAYQFGGMDLLNATIEKNFGIHIDGDIEVNFQTFAEAVNIIGNVDIQLSAAEAKYLNNSNSNWNLKAGNNSLNGEQTLAYSRIRYVGHADYERTSRQRTVLLTIFNNLKNSNVNNLLSLSDRILPLLTTNMSQANLLSYIYQLGDIKSKPMETQRIPVDGSYDEVVIRNMEVLVPNLDANRSFIQQTIYN